MGLSGIVAQIVLLRELLVSFLGNELVLGIVLANWLLLEAAGSFLIGKTAEAARRKQELYLVFQLLFSLSLPLSIYFSRAFKTMLLLSPGEAVGFAPILTCSFLILLPVAVPHGALFTFGSKLHSLAIHGKGASSGSSIGRVYVLETLGSIVGGSLLTFLLVQRFHSFTIALGVSLINALISAALSWPMPKRRPGSLNRSLRGISILLSILFSLLLFSPLADRIQISSVQFQWRGLELVHTENSIYGNIMVTKREEQATFFTDGVPAVTTPDPDIASIEDFVHFPMLLHPEPESVLILSGGAGGMIREVLKHPVKQIEYVELDPQLLRLIGEYGSELARQELSDNRVEVHYSDGRFFMTRTDKRYDVVFIGLGSPQELQTNRLFSREFFLTAKAKMNREGIFLLSLPGSLTYLSEELRKLNACILETLKSVFPHVRIIPGDVNLYFASDSESLMSVNAAELVRRLGERKIATNLFTGPYIEYRLREQWLSGYKQAVEQTVVPINSDFRPVAVFYSLSYWNALFSPYLTGIFESVERVPFPVIAAAIAATAVLMATLFWIAPERLRVPVPYAVATTGFCGMVFDLAIIFTFQSLFGYLYYQIGLLVTVFMAGAAFGSFAVTRRLDRMADAATVFLLTELCLVCFPFVLPFVFLILSRSLENPSVYVLLYLLFLTMSFVSGMLTGVQFPLATKLHLRRSSTVVSIQDTGETNLAHTAGLLYGADLFGGYFGGLIGGVFLLPILGLKITCFILGMIKGGSFILVLLYTRIRNAKAQNRS
jgi:spermidine synthase